MGWFSGQSKAAKELERKRQQERDEENAKKADDVCEEQKTPYQKKVGTRRPAVLRCLHAIDATRIHQTRSWVVYFSNLSCFGPRRGRRRGASERESPCAS